MTNLDKTKAECERLAEFCDMNVEQFESTGCPVDAEIAVKFRLLAINERALPALLPYVRHDRHCPVDRWYDVARERPPCTCGHDETLAALPEIDK